MKPWNASDVIWAAPPSDILALPRLIFRVMALLLWTIICFPVMLLLRYGQLSFGARCNEYRIFRLWGRGALKIVGLRMRVSGAPIAGGGMILPNHISILDVPLLYAAIGGHMIAKAEVGRWPVMGVLARLQGTEFVARRAGEAKGEILRLKKRLHRGDRMILFAEATTSDGLRVLPFKSTLFEAMVAADPDGFVQPVSFFYHAPEGASANFYACWGEMELLDVALAILRARARGDVDIAFHEPIRIGNDRKLLCQLSHEAVSEGFERLRGNGPHSPHSPLVS